MSESVDHKKISQPIERCVECDREVERYNTFLSPVNEKSVVCWECLSRKEKGFNADRDFRRESRRGVIPR